jgi:hypothetical protein
MKKCDVFTPLKYAKIMHSYMKSGSLLEPSVGVGNLLIDLEKFNKIDVFDIEKDYLDKLENPRINKHHIDFINYEFLEKYDNIIMNPPYIRIQDMKDEYANNIKKQFPLLKKGNIDIYQAFIIKSLALLNEGGVCVSINPNSILYNKSCVPLMRYLINNKYIQEIIDYNSIKIFNNINVYCCIMVFTKKEKDFLIYNKKKINYVDIKENASIFVDNNINTIEAKIKTFSGIATLCDKIYIHEKKLFDEPCWRPIFKVSKNKIYYIIFPYINGKITDECELKTNNPKTYDYLKSNILLLNNRDKGKKKYEAWYAFGRKQGVKLIDNDKQVIFIPTLGNINFPVYIKQYMLFYSGICIYPIEEEINHIKACLDDEKNKEYLFKISSKRGSDWFNISSTNIKKLRDI